LCQQISKRSGVRGIAIDDQQLLVAPEATDGVDEVASDLNHPCFMRVGSDSGDLDLARRQLDHEKDVEGDQTAQAPDLDGEEVACGQNGPVRAEKLLPRGALAPFRCGVDSVALQDIGNRRPTHLGPTLWSAPWMRV